MRTLTQDIREKFKGKTVLVRVDWNVPIVDNKITDISRLISSKHTLSYLKDAGAKILILAHLGRPTYALAQYKQNPETVNLSQFPEEEYSFRPMLDQIKTALDMPLYFLEHPFDENGMHYRSRMDDGDIMLCENIRFFAGEEVNDAHLSSALVKDVDYFVNDAFSCSHRAHVSTVGVAQRLESYVGFSMQRELEYLQNALLSPKRPLWALVGGAKVSSKIDILTNLAKKVDGLLIGGAMANTFLKAKGFDVGKSLIEEDFIDVAKNILDHAHCEIILPVDARVATSLNEPWRNVPFVDFPNDCAAFDIGAASIKLFCDKLLIARTIVWNGPMGVFENESYAQGTLELAKAIALLTSRDGLMSIAGGGDTLSAINQINLNGKFTFTSTAGGAFLEWLEGKTLPGVQALL